MVTVPRYGYIIKEGGVPVLKAHSGRNVSLTFYKKKIIAQFDYFLNFVLVGVKRLQKIKYQQIIKKL